MMRKSAQELYELFKEKLIKYGFDEETASISARNFTENSVDGVYSHGVNRFPRVLSYLQKGYIKPDAKPECVASFGAFEKWDGKMGMGNSNAVIAMDRAIELAKKHGIGCVAMRHTNHWMRGGAFGIQAAKAGCVGICWTNTMPNMPTWGAKDRRVGNNPLVFCVPRGEDGGYVLVDGAMAQYSYGAIESARLDGRQLPFPGGFNEKGELTCDPAEIEKTWRVLPIGYWKGSGFSILMDMVASGLAEGDSTTDVGKLSEDEISLTQMFIAIDMKGTGTTSDEIIDRIIEDIKASERVNEEQEILYPSEKEQVLSAYNQENGVPVHESVWEEIVNL